MSGCTFDGDEDAVLWPLGDRAHVVGAIGLVDCSILGCRLQRIGFAYPAAQEETIKRGFNAASEG